jgi:NADP-dependent aldehyde dehydrogenase
MSEQVLIGGEWRSAKASGTFQAEDPNTATLIPGDFPVSTWEDCDDALRHAMEAAEGLRLLGSEKIASFLDDFARRLEERAEALVEIAHRETALPQAPRLKDVELPRTTNQLRQAAAAAREQSWRMPVIDTKANLRAQFGALGPIWVFGPNNFPFAYNSVAGGDFAAAIATGNPVIGKANSSHPGTTKLLAQAAHEAVLATGLPPATVQLLYRTSHSDGLRCVADPRTGALAYTGSRSAGLALKAAADQAGKLSFLELSSVNPIVILPGALQERSSEIAAELTASCLMGTGQFCTSPGMIIVVGAQGERFASEVAERFKQSPSGTLLSSRVRETLLQSIQALVAAGATLLTGGASATDSRYSVQNTVLRCTAKQFTNNSEALQTEAFGNATLIITASDGDEAAAALRHLEGNLTGAIYSAKESASDESLHALLEPVLRRKVGRLLNDKMPTGVAVSPAMNHGGPYPATGHPGFTAVGIPTSLRRFAMLECYDNVRPDRLPLALRDKNPTGQTWRQIDGTWTQADVQR